MENAGLSEQTPSKPEPEVQTGQQAGGTPPPEKKTAPSAPAANRVKPTLLPTQDIPIAVRETPVTKSRFSRGQVILGGSLAGVAAIALISGAWFALQTQSNKSQAASDPPTTEPSPSASPSAEQGSLLGHYPYKEAPLGELQAIVPDGSIKLRKAAAKEYLAMVDAARAEGVNLVPISGFRSKTDQDYLFFGIKAERGQRTQQRAQVSAPPGYSEHHTGYAIDIGDGDTPATHLNPNFDKTRAFQWLQANAGHFSFELSFPKGNRQGVSYEPWHWRYVGDRDSLETFYKARSK